MKSFFKYQATKKARARRKAKKEKQLYFAFFTDIK